jgi:hypothetical protein
VIELEEDHLQTLMARVRGEDGAALRELYELTSARLLHAISQAGASAHEDILVATYTRLWRGETIRWPTELGVMGSLLTIAFSELLDHRRHHRL